MRRVGMFVSLFFLCASAFAQNNRSAVSINGSDANPCTVPAPCRSFSAALAQTAVGGEVVALDSGGYGPFSITQNVTVSGAPGVHAAVTTNSSSTIGIAVTVPQNISATIRNLVILGGSSNLRGIDAGSTGMVFISNCLIRGFGGGAAINATGADVFVDHTVVQSNYYGILLTGFARITDSRIDQNYVDGIRAAAPAEVTVAGSSLSRNGDGINVISETARVPADVTIDHDTIVGNQVGLLGSSVDAASDDTMRIFGSLISYNNEGVVCSNTCVAYSYGDNAISGNALNFQSITLTPLALQ